MKAACHRAAIGLGSNLGDRHAHLAAAFDALAAAPATHLLARSSVRETAPVGPIAQGPFLNAVALIETSLPPRELLSRLHAIERSRGRDRAREQRWGPRTLDLDILLYDNLILDQPGLTIPHPRLHERRFVLEPLAEVWPDAIVPPLRRSVADLLAALPASVG